MRHVSSWRTLCLGGWRGCTAPAQGFDVTPLPQDTCAVPEACANGSPGGWPQGWRGGTGGQAHLPRLALQLPFPRLSRSRRPLPAFFPPRRAQEDAQGRKHPPAARRPSARGPRANPVHCGRRSLADPGPVRPLHPAVSRLFRCLTSRFVILSQPEIVS